MTPRQKLAARIGAGAVALVVPVVMLYEGTVLQSYRRHVDACGAHCPFSRRSRCVRLLPLGQVAAVSASHPPA